IAYLTYDLLEYNRSKLNFDILIKFVAYHEMYHHKVESVATKWEILIRKKLYVDPFLKAYSKDKETCLEETLANAYAYRQCDSIIEDKKKGKGFRKYRKELFSILESYIDLQGKPYSLAKSYLADTNFEKGEEQLLSLCYTECQFENFKRAINDLWKLDSQLLMGLTSIQTCISYGVTNSIFERIKLKLNAKFISGKQLFSFLKKKYNAKQLRQKGSHVTFSLDNGAHLTIPSYGNDIKFGTVLAALKLAGLKYNKKALIDAIYES
nr:type II toxin-antitoxin system HicA family toxin [Leptospira sp.]